MYRHRLAKVKVSVKIKAWNELLAKVRGIKLQGQVSIISIHRVVDEKQLHDLFFYQFKTRNRSVKSKKKRAEKGKRKSKVR